MKNGEKKETLFHGIGVSSGIAVGPVFLVGPEIESIEERTVHRHEVAGEMSRFEAALVETRRQIREIQKNLAQQVKGADTRILDGHLLVLDDPVFTAEVIQAIGEQHRNAEGAVRAMGHQHTEALSKVEDDYLRERVADVKDVVRRLLRNLRETYLEAHDWRRLTVVLQRLVALEPSNGQHLQDLAAVYARQGDMRGAYGCLTVYLRHLPDAHDHDLVRGNLQRLKAALVALN